RYRLALRRPGSPSEPACEPPANTPRSMPALKCRPVEESTTARTPPSSDSRWIRAGSSSQNSGTIEFSSSGRHSRTWATFASTSTSKQRMCSSSGRAYALARMGTDRVGLYHSRMAGHVFISYSHQSDSAYVRRLADQLTEAGFPVWYDQEI